MKKSFASNIFKGDIAIWIVFTILCAISVIEMYSSASQLVFSSFLKNEGYNSPVLSHLKFLVPGIGIVFLVQFIPFKFVRLGGYLLLALSLVLLTVTLFKGQSANEATRWMSIGGFKFQPSEFAKLSVIIVVADLISRIREKKTDEKRYFKVMIAIIAVSCALIFPENFSTAAMLFAVAFIMMVVGQISWKWIFMIVGVVVVGLGLLVLVVKVVPGEKMPTFMDRAYTWEKRIENFGDKSADEYEITDTNLQVQRGKIAIAHGGLFGVGPGNSEQRNHLPGAFSDFIFAIIIEESGLFGGLIVILLYLVLLFRAGIIATRSKQVFTSVVAIGLTLMIVIQAFVHMSVATGLGPVTGQPLPLISKGGTSIFMTCFCFGIILGAARQIKAEREKVKVKKTDETPKIEIEEN
jgi:cell division protein FtsW